MDKLNVLIAGSTGYIGTQLVKLLCKHKNIRIKYLCGNTSVGKSISYYDKNKVYEGLKNKEKEIIGAIGVIGPMRLNYAKIIPVVDYTANVIGKKFQIT